MTERLDKDQYTACLGDKFRLTSETVELELNLSEVNDPDPSVVDQAVKAGRPAPYSLIFSGPAEPMLSQGIYNISHQVLGDLQIFLVPVGPADGGISYEAVFN